METERFTEQQSLAVIARMIAATRRKLERGGGKPFLIWGYTTFLVAVTIWAAYTLTGNPRWMWLWFAIPPAGYAASLIRGRNNPHGTATSYTDRVVRSVWIVIGSCCVLVALCSPFVPGFPILFTEALLFEAGVAVTGLVIRIRYVAVLGFAGILLALPLLFIGSVNQILLFAAVPLIAMILPGHILNIHARRAARTDAIHV